MKGHVGDDDDDDERRVCVCASEILIMSRFWSRTSAGSEDLPCELVAGEPWIHEELLGLSFRISPHSFFQVNVCLVNKLLN